MRVSPDGVAISHGLVHRAAPRDGTGAPSIAPISTPGTGRHRLRILRRVRPKLAPDNLTEFMGIRLNIAPIPVGEAMFGMPTARAVMAGVRLGVFARLARGHATAAALAEELGLHPVGARHLLDSLTVLGHVRKSRERYSLSKRAAKWVDPASETYVGTFLENCFDFWEWWDSLEDVVRSGKSYEIHERDPDDPHWPTYIRGQYELARLSAADVARRLRVPDGARRLIDVAGGHGWYAAALCRRHPGLEATVFDLPASAAVGRQIVAEAGMSDRVRHVEGDALTDDLGGPYDAALCFNLVHHFDQDTNVELLRRIRASLRPGGTLAVLDLITSDERPDSAAFLGLFFYLTSAAATYTDEEVRSWFARAGFGAPRRMKIRSLPNQAVCQAVNPG
jgi:SAM-dependent methyltransferase